MHFRFIYHINLHQDITISCLEHVTRNLPLIVRIYVSVVVLQDHYQMDQVSITHQKNWGW